MGKHSSSSDNDTHARGHQPRKKERSSDDSTSDRSRHKHSHHKHSKGGERTHHKSRKSKKSKDHSRSSSYEIRKYIRDKKKKSHSRSKQSHDKSRSPSIEYIAEFVGQSKPKDSKADSESDSSSICSIPIEARNSPPRTNPDNAGKNKDRGSSSNRSPVRTQVSDNTHSAKSCHDIMDDLSSIMIPQELTNKEQMDRIKAINEIEENSFSQQQFKSSRGDKEVSASARPADVQFGTAVEMAQTQAQATAAPVPQAKPAQPSPLVTLHTGAEFDKDKLCHPNMFPDSQLKEEKWLKKLFSMRQRALSCGLTAG